MGHKSQDAGQGIDAVVEGCRVGQEQSQHLCAVIGELSLVTIAARNRQFPCSWSGRAKLI